MGLLSRGWPLPGWPLPLPPSRDLRFLVRGALPPRPVIGFVGVGLVVVALAEPAVAGVITADIIEIIRYVLSCLGMSDYDMRLGDLLRLGSLLGCGVGAR